MQIADTHIHIDGYLDKGAPHGITPATAAETIALSNLDAAVLMEHRNPHSQTPQFANVKDELEAWYAEHPESLALTKGLKHFVDKTRLLYGLELRLAFEGARFHVGHIFEGKFDPRDLPQQERQMDLEEVAAFTDEYPGITMLCHPLTHLPKLDRPLKSRVVGKVRRLVKTGIFDALEALNGEMILNPRERIDKTVTTIAFTKEMCAAMHAQGRTLALTGGSDAHMELDVGFCGTVYPDSVDLFEAIRTGQTEPRILKEYVVPTERLAPIREFLLY